MRGLLFVIFSFGITILAWGLYGPMLHAGQGLMADGDAPARLRPFVCIGLAYFAIGVIVPAILLITKGEKGAWSFRGILMSLLAGLLGAIGALGIVMAFTYGGKPLFVMPLVFGGAPVVNAFLTIYWSKRMKEIGPLFVAGLAMVLIGATAVLVFKPAAHPPQESAAVVAEHAEETTTPPIENTDQAENSASAENTELAVTEGTSKPATASLATIEATIVGSGFTLGLQLLSILTVIVCWGAYGPVLHSGQAAMQHSRMRPFLCVGLAYFAIAVVVPNLLLAGIVNEASSYTFWGSAWSLGAGAAGAIGALGIIMAFNFGGRPIYVMPLIFGGAPVVNAFATIIAKNQLSQLTPLFLAGLILVVCGAAMVLVFAPKAAPPAAKKKDKEKPAELAKEATVGETKSK